MNFVDCTPELLKKFYEDYNCTGTVHIITTASDVYYDCSIEQDQNGMMYVKTEYDSVVLADRILRVALDEDLKVYVFHGWQRKFGRGHSVVLASSMEQAIDKIIKGRYDIQDVSNRKGIENNIIEHSLEEYKNNELHYHLED